MGAWLGGWGGAGILVMGLLGGGDASRAEDAVAHGRGEGGYVRCAQGARRDLDHRGSACGGSVTTIVYKVVGNGSAVVEDMFPGSDHSMVTVCHLDGDELVMTHYLPRAGDQPRMKLNRAGSIGHAFRVCLRWRSGTNFDPVKDMHMHEGHFDLLDDGRVKAAWTAYSEGKPAGAH